jgi:hypothetical protein
MNPSLSNQQIQAVQRIVLVMLETIHESADGAPEGVLFAALQTQGCSLSQFQSLLQPLVARKYVTKEDHLLQVTAEGEAFIATLRRLVQQQHARPPQPAAIEQSH